MNSRLRLKFKEIKTNYGPDYIGAISSARGTNEENYLIQKFNVYLEAAQYPKYFLTEIYITLHCCNGYIKFLRSIIIINFYQTVKITALATLR